MSVLFEKLIFVATFPLLDTQDKQATPCSSIITHGKKDCTYEKTRRELDLPLCLLVVVVGEIVLVGEERRSAVGLFEESGSAEAERGGIGAILFLIVTFRNKLSGITGLSASTSSLSKLPLRDTCCGGVDEMFESALWFLIVPGTAGLNGVESPYPESPREECCCFSAILVLEEEILVTDADDSWLPPVVEVVSSAMIACCFWRGDPPRLALISEIGARGGRTGGQKSSKTSLLVDLERSELVWVSLDDCRLSEWWYFSREGGRDGVNEKSKAVAWFFSIPLRILKLLGVRGLGVPLSSVDELFFRNIPFGGW